MFNWPDYFELSQEFRRNGGEAYQRSAVSRAYYAMYHSARYKLMFWGEWPPPESEDRSDHEYLWETFSEKRDSASKEIGQLGDRLRKVRNKCDYADNINSVSDVVEVAMINAERLKTALENLK